MLTTPLPATSNDPPNDAPAKLSTALAATVNGPLTGPPARLSVPVTVLVPASVVPPSDRLVIVPPWKPVPSTTVPPMSPRFGTTSLTRKSVPPPVNCTAPGPLATTPATLKFPPLN